MDAECCAQSFAWTSSTSRGRRSRVVLAPDAGAKLAKTLTRLAGDGGKRARSPGRARSKPLKPSRRECRTIAVCPWLLTPVLSCCTGGLGCNARPAFPAPSAFGGMFFAQLGRSAPREADSCLAPLSCPASCGASSTPRPFDSSTCRSGILDRPVEPGDDVGENGNLAIESRNMREPPPIPAARPAPRPAKTRSVHPVPRAAPPASPPTSARRWRSPDAPARA